jgi:Leucine-rich repeat (LRR) protein
MMVLPLCLGLVKSKGEANTLNLTNYNLGDRYIIALAAGLKKAKNIEKCLLGSNRITDLGLGELAKSLGQEIVTLDLSNNKITQIDQKFLDMVVEGDYKLEEINLSNNLLKISSSEALLRSSKYSKHLIKLNLCKNKLNSSCLEALS